MRACIVLCLVAISCADNLGYNYQPVGHSFAPASGINYASASNNAPSVVDYPSASNDAPAFVPQTELDKEYYTYTANEDDFNEPAASNGLANTIKQALRVVFIKGPENTGLENVAASLANHAVEQKTAIYVLNKQADLDDLANKLNAINQKNNNKPEVHFVKYRTTEDAVNAQNAIQGQYDALGGNGRSYDGGVAPVLNFASETPTTSYIPPASGPTPSGTYLPVTTFRL